jgi:molecular chaperone DnaK (HSP70)
MPRSRCTTWAAAPSIFRCCTCTKACTRSRPPAATAFLGGEDIDARIIGHLADTFQAQHGVDLRADRMALQRLREAAERAKHELSTSLETEINLPFIAATADGPKHLMMSLTRGKLETLSEDIIGRTLPLCDACSRTRAGPRSDINEVLLVGGQTRMPRIQELVALSSARRARAPSIPTRPWPLGQPCKARC